MLWTSWTRALSFPLHDPKLLLSPYSLVFIAPPGHLLQLIFQGSENIWPEKPLTSKQSSLWKYFHFQPVLLKVLVYDKDFTPSMQQHTESSFKRFLQLKRKNKSAEQILKLREDDLHSGAKSSLINGW